VIWSQSFHRRDPQLEDVPDLLGKKLEEHLRAIATGSIDEFPNRPAAATALTQQDIRHAHSAQAYALVREIRALPGLDRFMMGETYENMRTTASDHPVVVLVGARDHFYALVLTPSYDCGHTLVSLDVNTEDLEGLDFTCWSKRAERAVFATQELHQDLTRLQLRTSIPHSSAWLARQLKTLWHKVVKPVLDSLGLKVAKQCITNIQYQVKCKIVVSARHPSALALVSYRRVQPSSVTCGWNT
jgi:hypothetical protein